MWQFFGSLSLSLTLSKYPEGCKALTNYPSPPEDKGHTVTASHTYTQN